MASEAIETVIGSYHEWKTLRQDWDEKFRRANEIYRSIAPDRYWPNSAVKRSNLPVQFAADHVDSAWPIMVWNLFFSAGEEFFKVSVEADTQTARAIQERMFFLLRNPDDSGRSGIWELSSALEDFIYLGFGATDTVWNNTLRRAVIRRRDPRKLYMPVVEEGWYSNVPAWIYRKRIPIKYLLRLKAQDPTGDYNIPSARKLQELADRASEEEQTIDDERSQDGFTGEISHQPVQSKNRSVPTLMYQSAGKIIWVIGGDSNEASHVILNTPNPLNFTTLSGAWYHPHRKGLTELLETEQNLSRKSVNYILDYLSIVLMPPRNNRLGAIGNPSNLAWHPAAVSRMSEEAKPMQVSAIPKELQDVIGMSAQRTERRSGMNQTNLTGNFTPSNANRTFGGIQAGQANANIRQFGPLFRADQGIIAPTLYKLWRVNRQYDTRQSQEAQSSSTISRVNREVIDRDATFVVESTTRTVSRMQLLQSLPMVMQHSFSPATVQAAMEAGYTPDFEELNHLLHHAVGIDRSYSLYRKLSDEELQAKQQREMQAQQQDAQTRLQIMQMKEQGSAQREESRREGEDDKTAAKIFESMLAQQNVGNLQGKEDKE